jgi:hypothetical protein
LFGAPQSIQFITRWIVAASSGVPPNGMRAVVPMS